MIDTSPLPNNWIKDYRGQKFNRLLVIAFDRIRPNGGAVWKCLCDCGNITTAKVSDLRYGHTKSCGCFSAERLRKMRTTHGMSKTEEYKIWKGIYTRCYNKNSRIYPHYGGRGITMCDQWIHSFENFIADMGMRPSMEYSIERIDNDGPYSPDNCRWATDLEQGNNTRQNHYITHNGETKTLAEWARMYGIKPPTLSRRLLLGWSFEKSINTPIK